MLWKNKFDDGLMRVLAERLIISRTYALSQQEISRWAGDNVEARIDQYLNRITIDFYKEVMGTKGPVEVVNASYHRNWWDMLVDQWAPDWFKEHVYAPRFKLVKIAEIQTWKVCPHADQQFSYNPATHLSWIVSRDQLMEAYRNA